MWRWTFKDIWRVGIFYKLKHENYNGWQIFSPKKTEKDQKTSLTFRISEKPVKIDLMFIIVKNFRN